MFASTQLSEKAAAVITQQLKIQDKVRETKSWRAISNRHAHRETVQFKFQKTNKDGYQFRTEEEASKTWILLPDGAVLCQ